MNSKEAEEHLRDALDNPADTDAAAKLADALEEIPAGEYLCGCPWSGGVIPHYCPTHHQPVVFVIQDPRK